MSENYTSKTFDCGYGRHALVHSDTEPMDPARDVKWVLPEEQGRFVHPTRLAHNYKPRHAQPGRFTELDLFITQMGLPSPSPSVMAELELADQAQAWRER